MPSVRQAATVVAAGVVAVAVAAVAVSSAVSAFTRTARTAIEASLIVKLTQAAIDPRFPEPAPIPNHLRDPVAALSRRPLDNGALARAALRASIAGKQQVARALMDELLRRDPRSRAARMWLMNAALADGHIGRAIAHLDRLLALNPQMQGQYFPILAGLSRRAQGERLVANLLGRSPPWRGGFLGYLNARHADANLIFRLTASPTALANAGGTTAQSALLQSLITSGDYDGAYLAWINFLPEGALAKVSSVYDNSFAGLPGPQPFNWTFNDGEAASVGIEAGQGLQVDYPGAQTVRMASQTLLLKSGQYSFGYVARGSDEVAADSGVINWHIECVPSGTTLLDLPVTGLSDRQTGRAARFTVPAGCNAQLLTLEGTAGTFPATKSVSFARVSVAGIK